MSPRAAWRLERLGFAAVYDYALGKVDWMAAGLPTVRADPSNRRAVDEVDHEPPTCAPDALMRDIDLTGHSVVVINTEAIVLGRLPTTLQSSSGDVRAEDVMQSGPTTVRANEPLGRLRQRMERRNVDEVIVTTPEGRLLGVLRR